MFVLKAEYIVLNNFKSNKTLYKFNFHCIFKNKDKDFVLFFKTDCLNAICSKILLPYIKDKIPFRFKFNSLTKIDL
jgi:hypothetical protein